MTWSLVCALSERISAWALSFRRALLPLCDGASPCFLAVPQWFFLAPFWRVMRCTRCSQVSVASLKFRESAYVGNTVAINRVPVHTWNVPRLDVKTSKGRPVNCTDVALRPTTTKAREARCVEGERSLSTAQEQIVEGRKDQSLSTRF